MLRHLARLSRRVPAAGPNAIALAVYATPRRNGWRLLPAADRGMEGVACVDDAARAVVLLCRAWQRHRLAWAREWAEGLLAFLMYMQMEDGRFVNFIKDWEGHHNLDGPTSAPGGAIWTARAMHALACAARTLHHEEAARRFWTGLPWLDQPTVHMDVRAVQILAVLDMYEATADPSLRRRAVTWAEEIASCQHVGTLLDQADQPSIHLWGHLQEGALARTGALLGLPELVNIACGSAETALAPRVRCAFAAPSTNPFDVSAVVFDFDQIARATGNSAYRQMANLARAWFTGRNPARRSVYDRRRGCVYDGIDGTVISRNAGAEACIEGALALFNDLPWTSRWKHGPGALPNF